MRFDKWQALGNDYVIVEHEQLPFELTPGRVRALCDAHTGIGADGVLELSRADTPGFVARLRIFNRDGSEAELSGNGAREAVLYLRRAGWTDQRQFSIQTAAGEIRPTILSETTCRLDMGRARDEGTGEIAGYPYQQVDVGNPQCSIRMDSQEQLASIDLRAVGPVVEHDPRFPNRTNVSFWAQLSGDRIRARIFERGVGETAASGTGACGAAVAHVLRGGDSPVTVVLDGGELEVEVGEDLHIDLTGPAEPVYAGELAPELQARLASLP
jgi:diaminopimelate epimerase